MKLQLELWWPDRQIEQALDKHFAFQEFLQKQANRLIQGVYQYDNGKPNRRAKFLTRLRAELDEYERTGNRALLPNISNYAFLEDMKPEHPKAHYKELRKSVTRDKLRMKI